MEDTTHTENTSMGESISNTLDDISSEIVEVNTNLAMAESVSAVNSTVEIIGAARPSLSTKVDDTGISDTDFKWYCIKTYTSGEEKVKKTIEMEAKRLGLEYCIREVVIPTETVFEVRNGKKKTKVRNFLPGYVLINAVISEQKKTKKKIIDLITDVTGAVSFVGRKNEPAALQRSEVERIFSRITERANVATIDTTYSKGDPIIVILGPFAGFKGTVFEVSNEKRKIKVEIVILGRKTPVELDFDQIEFDKPE